MTIRCPHCHEEFELQPKEGEKSCKYCGSFFTPIRQAQIYCSPTCRVRFHNSERMKLYNEQKKGKGDGKKEQSCST